MRKLETCRRGHVARRREVSQAAWEDLVRCYGSRLRGHVRWSLRRMGLPEDDLVDDRIQDVYFRLLLGGTFLLGRLRRWSEPQAFAYMARVAERVVLDSIRAQAASKRGGGGLGLPPASRFTALNELADPRGTPEDLAIQADWRRLLFNRCRVLSGLRARPAERRRNLRIAWRSLIEGWSSREIMRAEGGRVARSTVEAVVHRIKRRLILDLRAARRRRRPLIGSFP